MIGCVGSVEVAFAASYAKTPASVIRITTEPPRTLNLEEAEQSAGFFDFDSAADFRNRFIIWRANGSNLYLEELCLDSVLQDSSLCINLHGSQIIPGTRLFLADSFLFIYVPTQTALHRFFVHTASGFSTTAKTSILALLVERSRNVRQVHDSHELNSQSISLRAHIAHSKLDLYASFFLRDTQLIKLRMNSFPATLPNVEITCLHSDGFLQRMVRPGATKNVSSMASCILGAECLFFVLFNNGIIHVYSKQGKEYSKNLMACLCEEYFTAQNNTTFATIKIEDFGGTMLLLCLARNENNENYIMISRFVQAISGKFSDLLEHFKIVSVPTLDVIDFTCFSCNGLHKLVILSRNEFKRSSLMSAVVDWRTSELKPWETARHPQICSSELGAANLNAFDLLTLKRSLIFDPNNYSFDVVLRSALLVCRNRSCEGQLQKIQPNDWNCLKSVIDLYVNSPQFEEQYFTRSERALSRSVRADLSERAKFKFWSALEKSCNELLEADCVPLAIWSSNSFGLYGTLQKGRFTVHVEEDERMRWIRHVFFSGNQKGGTAVAFQKCLAAASYLLSSQVDGVLLDQKQDDFVHYFSIASGLAAEVMKKFVEVCSVELRKHKELSPEQDFTTTGAGAFLPSLLSAAVRQTVTDRVNFSDALLSTVAMYFTTVERFRSSVPRWNSVLSACEGSLRKLNKHYRILSQALSGRLKKTNAEVSVGDAFFFDGGLEVVKNHSLAKEYLEEDSGGEEMGVPLSETGSSKDCGCPSFLSDFVSTAIAVLWPENIDLHLAQYLCKREQYESLLDFCMLNEPYAPRLLHAFQFFKGVAYSGILRAEDATQMFFEAFKGMEKEDAALLRAVFPGKVGPVSEAEFFLKVMEIMEKQDYSEQVVMIGRLALQKVEPDDPLLAHVYTMLFKHELATSLYANCIQTLLRNPLNDNRKMCLRELIAELIDGNKRSALVNLDFGSMQDHVVEILEARARSADSTDEEFLFETLYAFHFRRNNFSRAALVMYEYAVRLRSQLQSCETLAHRCRILSVVQQSLLLLPFDSRYLTVRNESAEMADGKENESELIFPGKGDTHVFTKRLRLLDEDDIAKEFAIEDARLALLDDCISAGDSADIVSPATNVLDIIDGLLDRKLFDRARLLARTFEVPPYEIIQAVARECIYHYASGEKEDPSWLLKFPQKEDIFSDSDRCSAVLRRYVEAAAYDFPHSVQVVRSACDVYLRYQWPLPCWLSSYYEEHFLGDYLNLLLLYGKLELACGSLIKAVECAMTAVVSSNSQVILPYTAIDQLFYLAEGSSDARLNMAMKKVDQKLRLYFNRLDSFNRI